MAKSSKFDAIVEMKKKYDEILRNEAEPSIKEYFKELFEEFPNLESVKWSQYTPYFADGDACEFGVGEAYVKFKGNDTDGDNGDGYMGSYDDNKEAEKISRKINEELCSAEDALLIAFGDHAEVIVSKDKIVVEEYQHD